MLTGIKLCQENMDPSNFNDHESEIDSDEEDLGESIESFRDAVRDCLETDPAARSEEDIEILMEFTHTLEAFSAMTHAVRRNMCAKMVFAVVDSAGTVVMTDGEELDSWSVIINGSVRVEEDGVRANKVLTVGHGFGIHATLQTEYHLGVMVTEVPDCQFVCITQTDYYHILHEGEEALDKEEEEGELVKVSEVRRVEDGSRHAKVLLRATPDKLIRQLVEDNAADPNYVEDFLLCHRAFLGTKLDLSPNQMSLEVMAQLLSWFEFDDVRSRVTTTLLLWIKNHFTDFELDSDMMELLDTFQSKLEAGMSITSQRLKLVTH